MPPRKLTRHSTPESKMATEDLGNLEWERSKISQQDINILKKLGISGKQDALRFPKEESYPAPPMQYRVSFVDHLIRGLSTPIHDFLCGLLFMYGLQLHHLTPNSILHISIFITLCESFLGVQPNWSLWKRIFLCRRNGSSSVAYNIGGVVICVRPDVEYFDVKFPDSVQGWRKKWLYIHEENHGSVEDNIPPFDGAEKICRRRSWDAEATDEEKVATEALMTRIHELQNTRGQELSGIQITAYFLRIRVQPLHSRKNPLWMYAGDKDVDRLSTDLSVKDLEKLVRKISSLNKKDSVPTSCGVTPYSATNALPQNHATASPLSPLPKGGEVEERVVVTDDNQGTSRPESEAAGSRKSAASSEKDDEAEATSSTPSHPPTASPRNKWKRYEVVDSGTSKADAARAGEPAPGAGKKAIDLYEAALVSSGDEEEDAPIDATARTSTSRTVVVSEAQPDGDETSPPHQNREHPTPAASPQAPSPKRARVEPAREPPMLMGCSSTPLMEEPFMKELIHFGTQFIGYREYAANLEGRTNQEYELESPEGDQLLDALSLLEIHGDEARDGLSEAKIGLSRLFPYFFKKKEEPATFVALAKCFSSQEKLGLQLRQEGLKVGVEGTIALVAESQQEIDWARVGSTEEMETKRWQSLIKAAKPNSKKILAHLGYDPTLAPSSSKPEVK
ncbi:hypothetical protein QYE76_011460 [Lolium multiflorum]|uniref:Transposase (putative) gypsy type domain-containing protein n=1 Tax=Lolium multiflorum TaxID=4521 RepID=A0AAD8TYZ2_LOLMU|nr:hypothetical protein QYE76_011460 [Lolium multiflorum]